MHTRRTSPVPTVRALRLVALTFALACGGALGPSAQAADLSDAQRATLEAAVGELRQAQTNIKLAQDTAGGGTEPLKGSKAKLTAVRLGSAKGPLARAQAHLDKLPADNADVKKVQEQYDALKAVADQLEARVTGKAPEAAAGAASDQPSEGKKLDYRQEESLKNARFSLRDLKGRTAALEELVTQFKAVENPDTIDFRDVQKGINTIEVADRRVGETRDWLAKLPEDGAGVADTAGELDTAVASLEASREYLVPLQARLAQLIDPAQYPSLQGDLERLSELSGMYNQPQVFMLDRRRAADLVRELPAAAEEKERIVKAYALLIHQQTEEGKRFAGAARAFDKNAQAFNAAADQERQTLPGKLRDQLAEVRRIADQAVAEEKPLFFTGGIPQQLGYAEEMLVLCQALDKDTAAALGKEVEQLKADLKKAEHSLKAAIIAANKLPEDRYRGDDRATLEKKVADTWKKIEPEAEVLMVRLPNEKWKREVLWRNQTGTWYKIDRSRMQAQVIVKHDDKLAEIRPINLWIDHLSEDALTATRYHEKDEELQPSFLLPLEKVK